MSPRPSLPRRALLPHRPVPGRWTLSAGGSGRRRATRAGRAGALGGRPRAWGRAAAAAGPRPGARGSAVPALLLQVLIREVAEKEVRARRVGASRRRTASVGPLLEPGHRAGRGARGAGVPGGARAGLGRGAARAGPGAALTGRPVPAAAAPAHRLDWEGAPQDLPESGETFPAHSKETFPRVE